MIAFLIFFILLIRFLPVILKILFFDFMYIKIFAFVLSIVIIHFIDTIPIRRRNKLSRRRIWRNRLYYLYPIRTVYDHIWNIFILLIYPIIFVGGILWLRFSNVDRYTDL